MITQTKSIITRSLLKSLLIIAYLIFIQSLPLYSKPIFLTSQIVQTSVIPGRSTSNVSLLGGAYFVVLLAVGYAINKYFSSRKTKEDNAE